MSTPACLSGRHGPSHAAHLALVHLPALLDQRRELGRCDGVQLGVAAPPRRAPGRRRRSPRWPEWRSARRARWRGRRSEPRLGRDDAHHRHPALELLAQRGQRSGGGGVAGHHEQLRAALEQDARELASEAEQLVRPAVAVREASGVAEVEKVLVREATRGTRAALSARRPQSRRRRREANGQGPPWAPMVAREAGSARRRASSGPAASSSKFANSSGTPAFSRAARAAGPTRSHEPATQSQS